jgi:argininosuccinate lyase
MIEEQSAIPNQQSDTRMPHLWSGRFDADPDRDVFEFGASLRFDRRLFEDDVTGSMAWAEALGRAGVISLHDVTAIVSALEELREAGRWDAGFFDDAHDEDVHAFVERRLVERVGDAGRRLHTGRSRNEQVSTDLRLYLRRRVPALQSAIVALAGALADRASAAGQTPMPAYTHLRRAQPVLVAHFFLAHVAALRRDHARLADVVREADELPLGSGAVAGTSYPIDTRWLADRLGFSRSVANSMDAAGDRDFVSGFLHACALALVHLSRLAEDLIIASSEEFGFFDLSDTVATGSSLMPQKKNPDPLELVRGKAGRAIGHLAGWLSVMKGLPIGYSKDLQEDKEALFDAEDTLAASLRAMTTVVATLSLDEAAATNASSGLLLATDVADYLVSRGVAFRRAHEIVGGLVRQLLAEGRDFASLTIEEWRRASDLFDADVVGRVTARASIEAKRTPQSTAPAAVAAALADVRAWLARS